MEGVPAPFFRRLWRDDPWRDSQAKCLGSNSAFTPFLLYDLVGGFVPVLSLLAVKWGEGAASSEEGCISFLWLRRNYYKLGC